MKFFVDEKELAVIKQRMGEFGTNNLSTYLRTMAMEGIFPTADSKEESGRVLSTAYKCPQTLKGGHEWYKYVYDEYYDCIICPEYHPLHYSTTNREGYREYKSRSYICKNCPALHKCTHSRNCKKVVAQHVWNDYIELAEDARYTPYYKALYKKRKEKIERVFADAKEKHAMRYTPFRGLAQVTNWVRLTFADMNLKKLARWLAKRHLLFSFYSLFSPLIYSNPSFRRCENWGFRQAVFPRLRGNIS